MSRFSFLFKLLSAGAFFISSGSPFHFILAEYELERLPYSLRFELETNHLFVLLVSWLCTSPTYTKGIRKIGRSFIVNSFISEAQEINT
jgi:hypothetical protein